MAVTLMKKFNEIILPENLRKEIIEDLNHSPHNINFDTLTGYGALSEIQINGNDRLASKLLNWSIKQEPFSKRATTKQEDSTYIKEYNDAIRNLANDY